jgi:hypothetical protein
MTNRARIVLCIIEILDELKGDIAEEREFLKYVNDMIKKNNLTKITEKYIKQDK